ncbi:putative ankyrin-3-like isoform X4 [Rosellinia necatrix]|uniref:Putative ankyrin-3-like isoform X4 n=1 Tax=Rosellinia necatrix TaxID=77044 RepID=A0A1S8ABE8_ROSNE|nr:putative ankyrin-3-like isoform X4 [Rosellinia necatrix]
MEEDTINPAIVFLPAGVMTYNASSPDPPHTKFVRVDGLKGEGSMRLSLFKDSSPYHDCDISVSSLSIIGRDSIAAKTLEAQAKSLLIDVDESLRHTRDFCAFLADDLGGWIAKLALVMAAEEAEYQKVLDATQAIIFFGTPHRGSPKNSLDSAVHSIVGTCYQGILGDWFPETLNSLSRLLEEIDRKFRHIAHKFSIVSYYQTQPASASGPYQVIIQKECATLGLETEITIGVSRTYSEMRTLMNRHEVEVARVFLENSKIRHWDEFRYFMDMLEPAELGTEYEGRPSLSQRFPMPPSVFYRNNPDLQGWVAQDSSRYLCLPLARSADLPGVLGEAAKAIQETPDTHWIDCPSIAFSGPVSVSPGKSCILASLIHQLLTQQPRMFLYIRHLLPNLVDAMCSDMQTWKERCLWLCLRTLIHSPVRVAIYGFLHVETSESIGILQQIDSALDGTESRLRLVLVLAPGVETGIGNSHFVHLDIRSNDDLLADAGNGTAKNKALLSRNDMENILLEKLRLSLVTMERSDFIALIWIAFATRPLSLEELEAAVALDQAEWKNLLRDSKPPGHNVDERWYPHHYLAEKCLGLVREIQKSTHHRLATSFTLYAARNWICHYEMASSINPALEESGGYLNFVNDESAVQSWLTFVEYLSFPPTQRGEDFQFSLKISEPRLKCLLNIAKIEDLKLLFKLASRPSSLCGLERVLVYAAETADNDIFDRISMEPFSPEHVKGVSRALAISHGTIHGTLMKKAVSILHRDMIIRMQLEAFILGNTKISENLVSNLPFLPNAGESGLITDILIAGLEYDDEYVISDVCNSAQDAPWRRNVSLSGSKLHYVDNDSVNWSVLHAAAKYGNEKALSRILKSGLLHDISSIQGPQSPIFIAAAQGFPRTVDLLVSSGALVDSSNGNRRMSALHIASLLGNRETAETLLRGGANPTTYDTNGDYPLHFAIRGGHSHVAKLLVEHFPALPEPHNKTDDGTSMLALDRDVDQELANPDDTTTLDFSSAPLNYANIIGVTVLAEAAGSELADVCKLILQQGGDPNIRDDTGKVALHLAAKVGSASMVRDLIDRGSTTDQVTSTGHLTPMHYACYRGATDVVDLLVTLTDLSSEDDWDRTPISAAAYAGHLETVKLLHGFYDARERTQALCAAASQCHREVVEYFLNSGCAVDGVSSDLVPLLDVDPENAMMIQLLVQRGANLELMNGSGERAIHKAAEGGAYEATKILLDGGSPLETETFMGKTPLSLAIYWEYPKVVRLLLERNAKIRLPRRWNHYSSVLSFAMGGATTKPSTSSSTTGSHQRCSPDRPWPKRSTMQLHIGITG